MVTENVVPIGFPRPRRVSGPRENSESRLTAVNSPGNMKIIAITHNFNNEFGVVISDQERSERKIE